MDNTSSTAAEINMTTAQSHIVSVAIVLKDSLVINQNISYSTTKDLQLSAISSTNGSLTIEHKSTVSDGQTRFTGIISNGGGANTVSFTQTSGISKLTAANTYTGLTTVSGGTLTLGHATDTLDGNITVAGGVLDVDNPDTVGTVTLSSGTISGDSALTGTSYAVESGTISSVLAGAGAMTKTTAGTVTLSGANTYSGGTTVATGTLLVGNQNALGTGLVTLNTNTTFSQVLVEGNAVGFALPNPFLLNGSNVTFYFSFSPEKDIYITNTISGSGGMTVSGSEWSRYLTLTGSNSFSGGVTFGIPGTGVSGLSIGHANALGSGTFTSYKPSFYGGDESCLNNTVDLSAGGGVTNRFVIATDYYLPLFNSFPMLISGPITGAGSLSKSGPATLTLTGVNTFSGSTTISAGTLNIGGAGQLGSGTYAATITNNPKKENGRLASAA